MSVLQTLTAVRDLISHPDNWTQGESARDRSGKRVYAHDPRAVCWCVLGGIWNVTRDGGSRYEAELYLEELWGTAVSDINDSHTHVEILAKLDEAINGLRG